MKPKEEFFAMYKDEYMTQKYDNNNLIFYAVRNSDKEARYAIVNFLLDNGSTVNIEAKDKRTLLHTILEHRDHDIDQTTHICKRLIEAGVDINQLDSKNRLALSELLNLKFSDEDLEELYDLWFSQPIVDVLTKNAWGYSPLDLARKLPFRKTLVKMMEEHIDLIAAE